MHSILRFFLFIILIDQGFCCGKGHCRPRRGRICNNPNTPAPSCGNVINCLVGPNVQTTPFAGAGDSPQQTCDALNCNFQSACCWNNAQPPADQLNWVQATGQPDPNLLQKNFGTSTGPDATYLITASDVAGTDSQSAQFYSCPIQCTGGDIKVTLNHWASQGTKIQVCTETDPNGPPQNCQDLPAANGNADSVSVPGGQNQRVVIQAIGFTSPTGSVAMISNIQVQCDPCSTTSSTTIANTPAPTPSTVCSDVPCNFEDGSLCKYQGTGTAAENWKTTKAQYHNRLTGITKSGQGQQFAACYTKAKQGQKSVITTNTNFDKQYTIQYLYHDDTDGLTVKGCCNDESNCPQPTQAIQAKDYQIWQTTQFTCPAGTNKVLFVAENTKGSNEGAAGIDDIKVLECQGQDQSQGQGQSQGQPPAGQPPAKKSHH